MTEQLEQSRSATPPQAHRHPPPLAPTLALIVTLAAACFAAVMAVVLIVDRPTRLPAPFPPQNQDAETLIYLSTFVVILPLALFVSPRIARAIATGPNGAALPALTGLLAATLATAVVVVRAADVLGVAHGVRLVLLVAALWWSWAGATLVRAARPRPWPALLTLARHAAAAWALAAVLALLALLCFTRVRSISPIGLTLATLGAIGVLLVYGLPRRPKLPRGWAAAADVAVVGALLMVVPDLVIFRPERAPGDLAAGVETGIIQFHQNFLLGPANEVLHGGAMLVDTASQYGVASIYLLVGWFQVAPIGYGTFGLLDDALTALWFVAGYAVLRMAGVPRPLAASALGVAVVALVFNLAYPVGALPQYGPLRFGLPMGVVLAAVAAERWPRRAGAFEAAGAAVVGIAAIWSLEQFAYTAAVFAMVAGARAWLRPGANGPRLRWLARQALAAVLAAVTVHVIFAAATLAVTGDLPNWGQYIAYLRAFLFGEVGELTYDVPDWSPALPLGAGYVVSAAAIVELGRRRTDLLVRERPAAIALVGTTAYGIVLLSYFVDRSQDHILVHVGLPGLLTGALWLSVLLRAQRTVPAAARRGGLAIGLAVGVLLVAAAWPSLADRFPRSALAHAAPGGASLRGAMSRLWHPPPLNAAASAGERLLDRYMPGERRSLVMVSPDLQMEILLRSDRVDELFLGDPWEASFVVDERLPDLREAVSAIRPGERMLMDQAALRVLAILHARPSIDPIHDLPRLLAPLQGWALQRIDRRFRLRAIHRDARGFAVVELERRVRA